MPQHVPEGTRTRHPAIHASAEMKDINAYINDKTKGRIFAVKAR
jgi:hypothetical protein